MINEVKANNRSTFKYGFNFAKADLDDLNPVTELIFNVADCSFLFQNNQAIATGIMSSNQKLWI